MNERDLFLSALEIEDPEDTAQQVRAHRPSRQKK